jgi:hypothetical protein
LVAFLRLGNLSCGSTGVKRLLYLLLALFLSAIALRATARQADESIPAQSPSLANARRAQALLGAGTWSRVIRVDNPAGHRRYPATVFALVFEEAGLLWFYTDTDGTQSFSEHPDRLAEEKSDFAPLLHGIDPGFAAYSILPDDQTGDPAPGGSGALLNGCFVESLAALQERIRRGEPIDRARLLSCYIDTPVGRRGHTVLTYETPRGLFLLDPARSPQPRSVPREWADDARALAGAALHGAKVALARWVPTTLPPRPAVVAAAESLQDRVPGAEPRL